MPHFLARIAHKGGGGYKGKLEVTFSFHCCFLDSPLPSLVNKTLVTMVVYWSYIDWVLPLPEMAYGAQENMFTG